MSRNDIENNGGSKSMDNKDNNKGTAAMLSRYLITQNTINSIHESTTKGRNALFCYIPGEIGRVIGFIIFTIGMTTGLIPAIINSVLNFIKF